MGKLLTFSFTILFSVLILADPCSDFNLNTQITLFDAPIRQYLIASDDIYVLTEENSVYKSSDAGYTWTNQMEYLEDSDVPQITRDKGVQKMYRSDQDTDHVVFLGYGTQYWTTLGVDGAYSYYSWEDYVWTKILPSPVQPDVLIGIRFPITCNTDFCYKSALISTDLGRNWELIRNYTGNVEWDTDGKYYLTSVDDELQEGNQATIPRNNFRLYRYEHINQLISVSEPGYAYFALENSIVYVVYETEDSTMSLLISTDRGETFKTANFTDPVGNWPTGLNSYTLLDNSEQVSFLHVNREATSSNYGTLYQATTTDGEFWLCLRNLRIKDTVVDFQRIEGLDGIYFANVYNVSMLIGGDSIDKRLASTVSYNKGAVWEPIPSVEGSELHLIGNIDGEGVISAEYAPGILVSSGNGGPFREVEEEALNLYLSRDAGHSWTKIQNGSRVFEWGNYGGLFVTLDSGLSSELAYSWKQGLQWHTCDLDGSVDTTDIIRTGDEYSAKFIAFGTKPTAEGTVGAAVYIDVSGTLNGNCSGSYMPDEDASQFETWSTKWGNDCLLGNETTYVRRKQNVQCLLTSGATVLHSTACSCTRNDYTCDGTCWEAKKDNVTQETVCVSVCDLCSENITSTGYTLVTGDVCTETGTHPPSNGLPQCAGPKHSPTYSIFAFFTLLSYLLIILFILLIIVILVLYKYNDKVHEKLSPFIPLWCTRETLVDPNDNIYSHLDELEANNSIVLDDL